MLWKSIKRYRWVGSSCLKKAKICKRFLSTVTLQGKDRDSFNCSLCHLWISCFFHLLPSRSRFALWCLLKSISVSLLDYFLKNWTWFIFIWISLAVSDGLCFVKRVWKSNWRLYRYIVTSHSCWVLNENAFCLLCTVSVTNLLEIREEA